MSQIPTKLNGFPVIAVLPRSIGSFAVLVHREGHPYHPYVTAVWSANMGDSWVWGHYFATHERALEDLKERAQ